MNIYGDIVTNEMWETLEGGSHGHTASEPMSTDFVICRSFRSGGENGIRKQDKTATKRLKSARLTTLLPIRPWV